MSANALSPTHGSTTTSPGLSPTPTIACDSIDLKSKFDSPIQSTRDIPADMTPTRPEHHRHESHALPGVDALARSASRAHIEKHPAESSEPKIVMSQRKKWALLAVFSLGMFIDIWVSHFPAASTGTVDFRADSQMYSAFFIFTGPISLDFDVPFELQTWVITSYAYVLAVYFGVLRLPRSEPLSPLSYFSGVVCPTW